MNIKGSSGKQSSIGTATSLLTTYMKKVYDSRINADITNLLEKHKEAIDKNIHANIYNLPRYE